MCGVARKSDAHRLHTGSRGFVTPRPEWWPQWPPLNPTSMIATRPFRATGVPAKKPPKCDFRAVCRQQEGNPAGNNLGGGNLYMLYGGLRFILEPTWLLAGRPPLPSGEGWGEGKCPRGRHRNGRNVPGFPSPPVTGRRLVAFRGRGGPMGDASGRVAVVHFIKSPLNRRAIFDTSHGPRLALLFTGRRISSLSRSSEASPMRLPIALLACVLLASAAGTNRRRGDVPLQGLRRRRRGVRSQRSR